MVERAEFECNFTREKYNEIRDKLECIGILSSDNGAEKKYRLHDGSEITLDYDTAITVNSKEKKRKDKIMLRIESFKKPLAIIDGLMQILEEFSLGPK